MGVPRIRLALDAVECEVDADRLPRGADPLIDLGCTLRSAELRFDIRTTVDAFLRQGGRGSRKAAFDYFWESWKRRREIFSIRVENGLVERI